MGPIQGDQPRPKANPKVKEPISGNFFLLIFVPLLNPSDNIYLSIMNWMPSNIAKDPPAILIRLLYFMICFPILPAPNPRIRNISEIPKRKERISRSAKKVFLLLISSMLKPAIKAK
ncbi:MAG: hypothetical protein PWQ16_744 [bacterium]|nr:MAG: hypothetical protein XD52_0673 [bacterium 42_11]MDK2871392.1 hypothetical protein [bacterium]